MSEETKVELYNVGDVLYANVIGLNYIEAHECESFRKYVENNAVPFIVDHVGEYEGKDTIYTCKIEWNDEPYEIQLTHEELTSTKPEAKESVVLALPLYEVNESTGNDIIDNYFEIKGKEIGALVDRKQKAYGKAVERGHEVLKAFLFPYLNEEDDTYTIPKELLLHLQLLVRSIDKFNRIVNNPKQDLMQENTYDDLVGYALIGGSLSGR